MSGNLHQQPPAQRGRPRDPQRDRAILLAARSVLAAKGYTGASMDEIARTAGVGKDTLYRRWSSKAELVRHLLSLVAAEGVRSPELDGDPDTELLDYLRDIVRLNTETDFGAIVAGVVSVAAHNPELAEAFRAFWHERRQVAAPIVRNIVGQDLSDTRLDLVLDQVFGPIYYRFLLSGAPVTEVFLREIVGVLPRPDVVKGLHT